MINYIVASRQDMAAKNIAEKIITNYRLTKTTPHFGSEAYSRGRVILEVIEEESVYADRLSLPPDVEAIVFVSRHSSKRSYRSLTVHAPGNLTRTAPLGGLGERLATAHPKKMKAAIKELYIAKRELNLEGYHVSLEATHHGPTELDTPTLFVEIGSSEAEWRDEDAGIAAARAAYTAATTQSEGVNAVGFGGGHYPEKHTEAVLKGDLAIGHILPKYFFPNFEARVVEKAFERTSQRCEVAAIDWKGLKGASRRRLINLLEALDVKVVRL